MRKKPKERDWWTIGFVVLLCVTVLLKLHALSFPLSEDEGVWAKVILHGDWHERFARIPHPPLAMAFYVGAAALGLPLKLVSLLVASIGALVLFLALRKLFGSQTAALAASAVILSPLFTVASLQLDIDGSFLLLFAALLFYVFVSTNNLLRRIVLLSVISGLMLLTKYTSVAIFLPFWIALLVQARKRFQDALLVFAGGVSALFIGALFPLYSVIFGKDYFALTRQHGGNYLLNFASLNLSVVFLVAQVVLLLGPLVLYLVLRRAKYEKKQLELWRLALWTIISMLIVYLVIVTTPGRPLERYLAPLLVPLGIIAGFALQHAQISKKSLLLNTSRVLRWTLIAGGVLFVCSAMTTKIIPFTNKFAYLTSGLSFLVPFRGSSGPFGFYVSSIVLFVGFLAAALGIVLFFSRKRTSVILVGIMIAASIVMNAEALYAVTTPDVSLASSLLDAPVQGKLLTHRDFGIGQYPDAVAFWDGTLAQPEELPNVSRPYTVIVLNFPPYGETPLAKNLALSCILEKTVTSRDVLLGQRFFCK